MSLMIGTANYLVLVALKVKIRKNKTDINVNLTKDRNMKHLEIDSQNQQQELAFDIVANTNTCVFITGKAGTGKTTFVKRICEEINKRFVVLAPTGIAAIAVGGQTMHSFFGFPLEVLGPHSVLELSLEKRLLIERTDTFILDEVSMVRSDMVDCMDRCLRGIMNTHAPFGGKQVVFVGDLYQLPPVVNRGSADEDMLNDLYGGGIPFFYKAHVLKRMNLPKIEFLKIYRQDDPVFVGLLNKMRVGTAKAEDLKVLNERVSAEGETADFSVTLTAYNKIADGINERRLNAIEEDEYIYNGVIEGDFKLKDALAPEKLKLKVGAQVIFCRNDYSNSQKYVNGTIAQVVELKDDEIKVRLENGTILMVDQVTWENRESRYNEKEHKMESQIVGTYTQYPLKLAWAITIHKSQGMTFERMHLDLTRGTFAPGQAYVAVSRMRSLEGLTLSRPLLTCHITLNPEVRAFANSFNDTDMINDELEMGRMMYRYLAEKDYDKAVACSLAQVVDKACRNDLRNAALIAKRMFDIMLNDEVLLGRTADVKLLKDCSMTSNFLNAVFCLYGNRYEEAIGYANMVLARKVCLEAMYIKGRALYTLGMYDAAYDMNLQIQTASKESEERMGIDKKQYLFEAKVNDKVGNQNLAVCKRLIKLCPTCWDAYLLLKKDFAKNGSVFEVEEQAEDSMLIGAFMKPYTNDVEFTKLLMSEMENNSKAFHKFCRRLQKLSYNTHKDEAF